MVPRLELAGSTLDDVPVEVTYGSVSKLGLGLLCGETWWSTTRGGAPLPAAAHAGAPPLAAVSAT